MKTIKTAPDLKPILTGLFKSMNTKSFSKVAPLALLVLSILVAGCKKNVTEKEPSLYGYGKLSVKCENKCHIEYGKAGEMNVYDVEATTGVYYFKYQANYQIDINVTPVDATQTMTVSVANRDLKQIYSNTARKKVGEVWNNLILVP